MHFHWQNLNEKGSVKGKTIKGSPIRHGRAWLRFGSYEKRNSPEAHWEWNLGSHHIGLELSVGDGDSNDGVQLFFGCGLIALWFAVEGILPKRFIAWGERRAKRCPWMGYEYMQWPRSIGVRIFSGAIWFDIWNWDGGWSSKQPKWLHFNFSPSDFFLGRPKHSSRLLGAERGNVYMPEGPYPVTVEMREDAWKRPRWPWPKKILRAYIDCPQGIPFPGKGENSWDCGEDATFSLTCPAKSVQDAISQLQASVLRDRERYGGRNWQPESQRA
jgi:hypothetical protein